LQRKSQIRVTDLSRFLIYILAHRPDEFGLVPDPIGFVSMKELLRAIHEEPGWGYVREGHLREVLIGKDRALFARKIASEPLKRGGIGIFRPFPRHSQDPVCRHQEKGPFTSLKRGFSPTDPLCYHRTATWLCDRAAARPKADLAGGDDRACSAARFLSMRSVTFIWPRRFLQNSFPDLLCLRKSGNCSRLRKRKPCLSRPFCQEELLCWMFTETLIFPAGATGENHEDGKKIRGR
jgi:hypothetical protein